MIAEARSAAMIVYIRKINLAFAKTPSVFAGSKAFNWLISLIKQLPNNRAEIVTWLGAVSNIKN